MDHEPVDNGEQAALWNTGAAVRVTQLDADRDAVTALSALLSPDEQRRACLFKFERDRHRYTVARARLRQLLALRLDESPQNIQFEYGAQGKPALAGQYADSGLCFNVSHCDNIAVYAVAVGRQVGIDIERIRPMPDADDIAERFFSRAENDAYRKLDVSDKPLGFFNCWTRKEAFVKALGDGLDYPLDRFDVSLSPGEPARLLRIGDDHIDISRWTLQSFVPAPGFVGTLVVQNPGATISISDRLQSDVCAAPVICD